MILVTGGAGFIGSNFVKYLLKKTKEPILVLDYLTYASELGYKDIKKLPVQFVKANILNYGLLEQYFKDCNFSAVVNFAAESHVDNSIDNCYPFIETNITGTVNLLNLSVKYKVNKFLQISTDEVFGSIDIGSFTEQSHISPNNPYSASKAAAEHFVHAYSNTYGLNTLIVNCSNNYGPNQYPEKLIPLTIKNLIKGKNVPVYGKGAQIRDWLFVEDCCEAIYTVLDTGNFGERYCIGGNCEITNLNLVKKILNIMELPESRIEFVTDRPGHDFRYSTDISKIKNTLGWSPKTSLENGLTATINRIKGDENRFQLFVV